MVNFDLGILDYQGTLQSAVTMLEFQGLKPTTTDTANADGTFTWYDDGGQGDSSETPASVGSGGAGDNRTAWNKVFQISMDGPDVPTEITTETGHGVHFFTFKDSWLSGSAGCFDVTGAAHTFLALKDIVVVSANSSNVRAGHSAQAANSDELASERADVDTSLASDYLRSIANEVQGGLATGETSTDDAVTGSSKGLSDILVGETQILNELQTTVSQQVNSAWNTLLTNCATQTADDAGNQGQGGTRASSYRHADNLCARIFDSLFYSQTASNSYRNRLVEDLMKRPATEAGELQRVSLFKENDTITFHLQVSPSTGTTGTTISPEQETVTASVETDTGQGAGGVNVGANDETLSDHTKTISSRLYKIVITLKRGGQ